MSSSTNPGTLPEIINIENFATGDYSVRVSQVSGDAKYDLSLTFGEQGNTSGGNGKVDPITGLGIQSGYFSVGETGEIGVNFLFDGGWYSKGELGIFSLDGMEKFEPGSREFIQEVARRALSDSVFGHVVIADATEGAKFSGQLGEANYNAGQYQDVKSFAMRPGDKFGIMLVPNGSVQQLFDNPSAGGSLRPLFSLTTANPYEAFHVGQIADVTGDGSTFVMEDQRVDQNTDRDYNDLIFQIKGATGQAVNLDQVIDPVKDWRNSTLGSQVIAYVAPETTNSTELSEETIYVQPSTQESSDPNKIELLGNGNNSTTTSDLTQDTTSNTGASLDSATVSQTPTQSSSSSSVSNETALTSTSISGTNTQDVNNTSQSSSGIATPTESSQTSELPATNTSISDAAEQIVDNSISVSSSEAAANQNVITTVTSSSVNQIASSGTEPTVTNSIPSATSNQAIKTENSNVSDTSGNLSGSQTPTDVATSSFTNQTNLSNTPSSVTSEQVNNASLNQTPSSKESVTPDKNNDTSVTSIASPVIQTAQLDNSSPSNNFGSTITVPIEVGGGNSGSSTVQNWIRQTGTSASDRARGVTVDQTGNVYVAGATDGALDGFTSTNNPDPFITKYDVNGNKLWTRQLGTSIWDFHTAIATDSNGNLFTSGYNYTNWANESTVAKWDSNGNLVWNRLIASGINDWASDVTTDSSGNVYVTGHTEGSLGNNINAGLTDAFVAKYDSFGNQLWLRQLGTQNQDEARSVVTDKTGNVYIAGVTNGSLDGISNAGGTDVFVTKYDSLGNKLWTHLLGTAASEGNVGFEFTGTTERNVSIALDNSGNLYISGRTEGSLDGNINAGGSDSFLSKFDTSGNKLWTREFGGIGNEYTTGVGVDSTGNIIVSGATSNSLNGQVNSGGYDAFIVKFDSNGNALTTSLLGSTADDVPRDIAVDKSDNIFIAGYTGGSLAGSSAGDNDIFVAKYSSQSNQAPVVTITNNNQTVISQRSFTPSFSVTDADGDVITRYRFQDNNNSSSSGYFTLNGVQQAANQIIEITANQLASVKFVGGTTAGTDNVYIQAFDGKDWGNLANFSIQTKANSRPVISVTNQTVIANQSIVPSFAFTDADGDTITQYLFRDDNTSATSGYFTVNGVKQAAWQPFSVAANQLNTVRFVGGSVAGDDQVWVWGYDGYDWSAGKPFNITTQTLNTPPVVNISNTNQTVIGKHIITPSFSVTDVDGDVITSYRFWDGNNGSTSGYFTLNGVQQTAGQSIEITANQLASLKFVGGTAAGTDNVYIQAFDGKDWGNWNGLNIQTTKANTAPGVSANNQTVNANQTITPAFTVTDADSDTVTRYRFWDGNSSSTSGYFTINGVKQTAGQSIEVTADQLSTVKFVGGSVAGDDTVYVSAYDGYDWGNWTNFNITTQKVNTPPVVNISNSNQTVVGKHTITPSFNVTDVDGDVITSYRFWDGNNSSTSGYFTLNGVQQTAGQSIEITANQLASLKFVGGTAAGTDNVYIQAFDGKDWGNWNSFNIQTTKANTAPGVSANNQTVNANQIITPAFTVTDADSDTVTCYRFWDGNSSSTSGYFTINGVKQTAGQSIEVTANQLSTVKFVGGSVAGDDTVYVSAYDGYDWGNWTSFNITTQKANSAPVVNPANQTAYTKHTITPSLSVSDADGDVITGYYLYDGNTDVNSGYFSVNGVKQAAGTSFYVAASQLANVKFVAGTVVGSENLYAQANDGKVWSNWTNLNIQTQLNPTPVISAANQTVLSGQPIMPSFIVSDANGDLITQYAFYDGNTSSTSGYFTVNGVKQAAGQVFYVPANQISTVRFIGGSTTGDDSVYAQAYDGYDWGSWTNFNIKTNRASGSKPIVNANNQTVDLNQTITPAFTVTDADNDSITQYAFYDGNASSTSGYFTVNGVKQAAGQTFYVAANQLNTVKFVGGSVAVDDNISIAANDGIDGWSNAKNFTITTKATSTDWFDTNIKDAGIRSLARSLFLDGSYSRDDMVKIFRQSGNSGYVDATEYADLQTLVNNTSYIQMPDYVRVLSKKVAIGNPANQHYKGNYLGDLQVGYNSLKLDNLSDKWFYGGDLPSTYISADGTTPARNITYGLASGTLFGTDNTFSYTDIKQGYLGDCYFLSSLGANAWKRSSSVNSMFIDNGDGTFTVRFYGQNSGIVNGPADYLTVDKKLPTSVQYIDPKDGISKTSRFVYYDNANVGLWVALAEKAYAQFAEAGTTDRSVNNNYGSIEGGWGFRAMPSISGINGGYYSIFNYGSSFGIRKGDFLNLSDMASLLASGVAMTADTIQNPSSNLVGYHEYIVVSVNTSNGTVTLYNPHGFTQVVSYNDFKANFSTINVA